MLNRLYLLMISVLATSLSLKAQVNLKENIIIGTNYFATLAEDFSSVATKENEDYLLKFVTKSNPNISFKFNRQYSDEAHNTYKKYNVLFKEIPIFGMDFVIQVKASKIFNLIGTFENIDSINVVPKVNEVEASKKAASFFYQNTI
jgi:Zn-dependent metalloprotease